jgi:hypothetical protein
MRGPPVATSIPSRALSLSRSYNTLPSCSSHRLRPCLNDKQSVCDPLKSAVDQNQRNRRPKSAPNCGYLLQRTAPLGKGPTAGSVFTELWAAARDFRA